MDSHLIRLVAYRWNPAISARGADGMSVVQHARDARTSPLILGGRRALPGAGTKKKICAHEH
jgi:hypothetical protein